MTGLTRQVTYLGEVQTERLVAVHYEIGTEYQMEGVDGYGSSVDQIEDGWSPRTTRMQEEGKKGMRAKELPAAKRKRTVVNFPGLAETDRYNYN
ncbi:hypothetical protein JG688_00011765 [Phytophthora aleatoria]|uniref:Uncharacterized protein n=1 Tax=Phytophthora aleatoria TaxID=2496075 RepID=A0A8J5MEL6_9STRA|nr:hypothetical protein JG688_00011765 [Phytophthora aleatoria]